MDKIKIKYQLKNEDWKPSPITTLATSIDGSRVAASREDGSLELWLVSPNTIGWHCQLTIHGDPNRIVSSLVWCPGGENGFPHGRLFSSNIDGSISFWDLSHLKQTREVKFVNLWKRRDWKAVVKSHMLRHDRIRFVMENSFLQTAEMDCKLRL